MAKFALAGGHSKKAPGASGYINEYTHDRIVNNALIAEMKRCGHTVKNCSNEASTVNAELAQEVYSANSFKADIFCATHFNAYKTTTGKRGVEVWYYTGDATGKKIAAKMAKDLAKLFGLPNRGAKATTDLYVIVYTNMTAVLPEVCFCDAKGDTDAYLKKKSAEIAKVMANALELGVGGSSSSSSGSSSSESSSSGSSSSGSNSDVKYALHVKGGSWLGEVTNFNNVNSDGYAGYPYKKHDLLYVKSPKVKRYRVHTIEDGWLPYVYKGDKNDTVNGCAGILGHTIDGVDIDGDNIWFRSQTTERSGWLSACCEGVTTGDDAWAGMYNEPLDRLQVAHSSKNPF